MSLFKQMIDEADELDRGSNMNSFELLHFYSHFHDSPYSSSSALFKENTRKKTCSS